MRVSPEDLETLVLRWSLHHGRDWQWHFPAIIRVCDALEPSLAFQTSGDRATWLTFLEQVRGWMKPDVGDPGAGVVQGRLQTLEKIAKKSYVGPLVGQIRELNFVRDAALKRIAERDYASMERAVKGDQTKVAVILAGSVLEAILLDIIERDVAAATAAAQKMEAAAMQQAATAGNPRKKVYGPFDSDPTKWKAYQMIAVAGPGGLAVLSEKAVEIASACKDWRNYVHPDKERRESVNDPLTPPDGPLAFALVEKVIYELEQRSASTGAQPVAGTAGSQAAAGQTPSVVAPLAGTGAPPSVTVPAVAPVSQSSSAPSTAPSPPATTKP